MAIVMQDGSPFLMQDGSPLLEEGGSASPSASLTVTPSFSAAGVGHTHTPSASLTVTPALSAAAVRGRFRTASLTVTPSLSATPAAAHVRAASLTVTPVLAASRVHTDKRSASLTVAPVLRAAGSVDTSGEPGYPDGPVGAKVELLLGGTWTDITAAAIPDGQQAGSIKSGQPDGAQQPSAATMNGTWDNPDYSLSPRNSAGPYFGELRQNTPARVSVNSPYGHYMRLEADDSDRAFVADTSALHVTGSLELRIGVILSDWQGCVLAARRDGTTGSWHLLLNSDGTLTFLWWDSAGTTHSVTSDAAAAVSWRAFRVTLNVSSGTVTFYVSDGIDGTWTQLGSALSGTSGSSTTVRAGNCPLVVGWSSTLDNSQTRGQVSDFRLYNGIGGTVVADAAFSAQPAGVTTWTDTPGLTWTLAGGAELTGRDYRLHGELSTLAPTADVSSAKPRLTSTLSGRLRRLQQGAQPAVQSPMRRAVLAQAGSLFPVSYWPMEEAIAARTFGPAVGAQLLTEDLGLVKPAADSSFEASAPLPTLNGDQLSFTVDTYTGGTAWAVRFLYKPGSSPPGTASRLLELTTTGAATKIQVIVDTDGTLSFKGFLSGGSSAFSLTEEAFPQLSGPAWWSVEATPSGSNVEYALVALSPGAGSGNAASSTVTGHGSFGNVSSGTVNADLLLTDTVFGHLSVQKAWVTLFSLGQPLNAWRGELAANRFARVCGEQGITARVIGRPAVTQAMGPQPRGSTWTILRDIGFTEQGILYEPRDCLGVGFRTFESLGAQAAAVTLSFVSANLRGDLQPVDDDSQLANDVTASMPDGTQYRVTLNDGSAKSVSEPKDGGSGTYASQPPQPFNLADADQLATAAGRYLAIHTVDEQRYRGVALDMGIPGAPAADIARLRPGDLVKITDVPGIYQTADIEALATGFTEAFTPGRRITCDTVPFSPYG